MTNPSDDIYTRPAANLRWCEALLEHDLERLQAAYPNGLACVVGDSYKTSITLIPVDTDRFKEAMHRLLHQTPQEQWPTELHINQTAFGIPVNQNSQITAKYYPHTSVAIRLKSTGLNQNYKHL